MYSNRSFESKTRKEAPWSARDRGRRGRRSEARAILREAAVCDCARGARRATEFPHLTRSPDHCDGCSAEAMKFASLGANDGPLLAGNVRPAMIRHAPLPTGVLSRIRSWRGQAVLGSSLGTRHTSHCDTERWGGQPTAGELAASCSSKASAGKAVCSEMRLADQVECATHFGAAKTADDLMPGVVTGPLRTATMQVLQAAAQQADCLSSGTQPRAGCNAEPHFAIAEHLAATGMGNFVVAAAGLLLNANSMQRVFLLGQGLPTAMLRPYFESPLGVLSTEQTWQPAAIGARWWAACRDPEVQAPPPAVRLEVGTSLTHETITHLAQIASAYESAISACPSTAEALEGFLSALPAPPGSAKNWESLSKVATMLSRARSISVRSGTHEASLGEGVCELLKHSIRREQLISVGIAAILSNPTTKMLDLAAQFKQRVKWDEFTIRVGLQLRQCVDCGWTNRAWNDQARLLLQLDCLRSVVAPMLSAHKQPALASSSLLVFLSTDDPSIFDAVQTALQSFATVVASGPNNRPPPWFHSTRASSQSSQQDSVMLDMFMLGETDVLVATGTSFSQVAAGRTFRDLIRLPYKDDLSCKAFSQSVMPNCGEQ